ncbi:MAG TPA: hypothetical protein VHP55_04660 [Usitatibacter sp.]|nr:hypothetical protein [Usitatibacter sp.]
MRIDSFIRILAMAAAGAALTPALAQESFDACEIFTVEDAQKILGADAAAEPVNPKVKRPKVIPSCTYLATKDNVKVAATALFKWGKTNEDTQRAFEDARMQFQTKPMLISGTQAFWSGKTGQMNLRKGRTWITVAVGSERPNERTSEDAKKVAEALAKRL